jgi:DNA-binding transcriptional ArsR family regulator
MEEEKIVLDRKSFEALAVDTRVKILKSLKERRKTLSELAKEQSMSVSGVKEHLETLEGVGLIEKIDDGHKWKYYELTKKGSDIVAPRELRVWILLSISTLALVASMFAIFAPPEIPVADSVMMAKSAAPEATMAAEADAGALTTAMNAPLENEEARSMNDQPPSDEPGGAEEGKEIVQETRPDLAIPIAVAVVSSLTLAACLGILAKNRMKPTSL